MTEMIAYTQKPLLEVFPSIPSKNDFSETLLQGLALAEANPEVLKLIEADQIKHAKEKKLWRILDRDWMRKQSGLLPLFNEEKIDIANIQLECGRERMPAILVLVFLLVRGFMGSLKSEQTKALIAESQTLYLLSVKFGLKKTPGISTILENVNLLSTETLRYVMKLPISEAKACDLDDFKLVAGDSTRTAANATWPTEAKTMVALLQRVYHNFGILKQNDIRVNFPKDTLEQIKNMQSEAKSIALESGKKGATKKRKQRYRKLIRLAKKLSKTFCEGLIRARAKPIYLCPSEVDRLNGNMENIAIDLHNLSLCTANAKSRVLDGKQVSPDEKVLGISDDDAVIVTKGMREPVYGFKPQIARSLKGFIVALEVPLGAASDKEQLRNLIDQAMKITSTIPDVITLDDGYTNKSDREHFLEQGVEVVSFSGANAKGIIPVEDYDSKKYQFARNVRSIIESSISKLKGFFGLNRLTRRGIEAVTQEMLTAAIYQNMQLLQRLKKA